MPEDHSLEVQQAQNDEADKVRQEQAEQDAANKAALAQLRNQAVTNATGNAQNYFTQQGLDPNDYQSSIDSEVQRILSGIAPDDPNPGAYFSNIGQDVYDLDTTANQNKQLRVLNQLFPNDYAQTRIGNGVDDSILSGIEGDQFNSADQIIQNMLNRGVITSTGYDAAEKALKGQIPGVNSQLDQIGQGQIALGQKSLNDITSGGKSTASGLTLGTTFDPYSYTGKVDQAYSDFISKLGDNIKAAVPGNLFDTSSLASIAGASQGAQNTKFDPNALAGILNPNANDNSSSGNRTNTTSVF
jgi:hypothetical protein